MQSAMLRTLALTVSAAASVALAQTGTLTVDQIVEKHAQAMGGADKLKAIRSMRMTGSTSVAGMDAPTVMVFKRPDKVRLDLSIMDQKVIQAADATSAWMVNPFTTGPDPQPMPEEAAADFRSGGEVEGALIDYKAKGSTLELLGKEDVGGKPAYKLKLVRKGGRTDTVYLDADTFLQVKAMSRRKVEGQEIEVESAMSDYRDVEGIKVAHKIEQSGGPAAFTMTIEKVEMNLPIEDSLFAAPSAAKQ
jgi:outer membrane lipoprotein-sorting protein